MTINLEEINRITLRTFKPFIENQLREIGIELPIPWNPTDDELEKLAVVFGKVMREIHGDGY